MTRLPTIAEAARDLRAGRATSAALVESSLEAIARHQGATNAFIRVDAASAREAAKRADADLSRGVDRGPLHGIPISLKDLIDVAGEVTTAASRVLRDRLAPADAPIVTRLRDAGAVLIGKTNLHEFALGTTSEDSAFGPVRNPFDSARSAGGSSGGSAAAVALGMGLASIGTDTGGSIRIPAAACGVVGLKPRAGEVPTDGIIPLSRSLDHAGPIARSVEDAAAIWRVLAGQPDRPEADAARPLRLKRLVGYFDAPIAPEVRDAFDDALARLQAAGASIRDAEFEPALEIASIYVDIVLPEAAAWHGDRLDRQAGDYTPLVHSRLLAGRSIPAVKYLQAQEARARLRAAVDALLADCDALILPTLPILAPPLGAGDITIDPAIGDRTPVRSAMLRQTQLFNLTGHPAISLPIAAGGMPVGLQLAARTTAEVLRYSSGVTA